MQLHEIKRKTPNKKAPLIGRGGKRGKTSGKGHKGQKARAGRKMRPEIRDIIKKLPKLRGYAFNSIQDKAFPVALSTIDKSFKDGDRVEPKTLAAKGIIEKVNGKYPPVKILSGGEITKKLIVSGCKVSAGAKASLEKAGGSVHA